MVVQVKKKSRYIQMSILGVSNTLDLLTGSYDPSNFDEKSTYNTNYGIVPNLVPKQAPILKCFVMGIGGTTNVNSTNLTDANYVNKSNMGLYTPLAFRTLPLEEDLSDVERAKYRLRYVYEDSKGNRMVKYFAKVIENISSKVHMTIPSQKEEYKLDYSKLNPIPIDPTINGVEDAIDNEVTVYKDITLPISGGEVLESVGVDYDGDLRYAHVSELGLLTGDDQTVTATDAAGNFFQMTELVGAQLFLHKCWGGLSFSTVESEYNQEIRLTSDDFIIA